MRIGHIDLGKRPVFLVPVEDVTDLAFCLMYKKLGADTVHTESISSDALIHSINKTIQKLTTCNEERPVAIQIYNGDTEAMIGAARIVEETQPDILDINFGCPVRKVAGKGAGAGMLQDIPEMLEITRAVVDAARISVTVKTRLGWDADHRTIVGLAEQLQDCGIAALAIYGRTRAQTYMGEADWILIGEVEDSPCMYIPIVGNDGVISATGTKECFERYGVGAIMIGRDSIGRPWIFHEVRYYPETEEELPQGSFERYLNVLREEVLNSVARLDEHRRIIHIRRYLTTTPLFEGASNFREMRIAMLRTESTEELFRISGGLYPTT